MIRDAAPSCKDATSCRPRDRSKRTSPHVVEAIYVIEGCPRSPAWRHGDPASRRPPGWLTTIQNLI